MIKKVVGLTAVLFFIGSATAFIPDITNGDVTPTYADYGEQVTVEFDVSGDDGLSKAGVLIRDPNGDLVSNTTDTLSSGTLNYNHISGHTIQSSSPQGEYQVELFAVDGGLRTAEFKTLYVDINEPEPTYNIVSPLDGATINYNAGDTGANVDFETDITPESSGTVDLFIDFNDGNGFTSYYSESVSSGTQTVSTTELISEDSNIDYTWEYTRDSTGNDFTSNVVNFAVNEVDNPPQVNGLTVTDAEEGFDTDVTLNLDDDVGLQSFDLVIDNPDNVQVASTSGSVSGTSDNPTINNLFSPSQSGTFTADIQVTDTNGQTTTDTRTFQVDSEPGPSFSLTSPADNEEFNLSSGSSTRTINYDGQVNSDFSGTLRLYRDGQQVASQSLSGGGDSYSFSETLGEGTYDYYIEAESSTTGDTYTSNTKSFSIVNPSVPEPSFSVNSPLDNEDLFISAGENSRDVQFTGTVDSTYDGTIELIVDGQQVNSKLMSSQTSYDFTETLGSGTHTYKIRVTSANTNDVYETGQRTFEVIQSTEERPSLTLDAPEGLKQASFINNAYTYDANVSLQFDASVELKVKYPSGYEDVITSENITPSTGFSREGTYSFDDEYASEGEYRTVLSVQSNDTGNSYIEVKRFEVNAQPSFDLVNPSSQESIELGDIGATSKQVLFSASITNVPTGTVKYKVSDPTSTGFDTVYSEDVNNFQADKRLEFSSTFSALDVSSEYGDDRPATQDFVGKVVFETDAGSIVESNQIKFNFVEPEPTIIENLENMLLNLLGPYALLISAIFLINFAMVYVGFLTENGLAALATGLLSSFLFVYLGWFPFLEGTSGIYGTIIFAGIGLYLADRIGGVIS